MGFVVFQWISICILPLQLNTHEYALRSLPAFLTPHMHNENRPDLDWCMQLLSNNFYKLFWFEFQHVLTIQIQWMKRLKKLFLHWKDEHNSFIHTFVHERNHLWHGKIFINIDSISAFEKRRFRQLSASVVPRSKLKYFHATNMLCWRAFDIPCKSVEVYGTWTNSPWWWWYCIQVDADAHK